MIAEVTELVHKHGYNPVPAHAAIEIKPPVVWSKGHAALLILNEIYGSNWDKNIRVIYLGDDTSDEDVMEVSCFINRYPLRLFFFIWARIYE